MGWKGGWGDGDEGEEERFNQKNNTIHLASPMPFAPVRDVFLAKDNCTALIFTLSFLVSS